MNAEALPGVGPALLRRIRAVFPDDDALAGALDELDLERLMQVEGVSKRRALQWVKAHHGLTGQDRFLADAETRRIRDRIVERIQQHAATPHGRNRLELLRPLPDAASATAHAAEVMEAARQVAATDRDAARALLRRLHLPRDPEPRLVPDRLVVVPDRDLHDRLVGQGLGRWLMFGTPEALRSAHDYDLVVVLGPMELSGIPNAEEVLDPGDQTGWLPERTLAWFHRNRQAIEAAAGLAELFGRPTRAAEVLDALDAVRPPGVAPTAIPKTVARVHQEMVAQLRQEVAGLALTGDDLVAALDGRPPKALQAVYAEVLEAAEEGLAQAVGRRFRPFAPDMDLTVDEAEVERVQHAAEAEDARTRFAAAVAAARRAEAHRSDVEAEIRHWLRFDATFALGDFANRAALRPARFGDELRLFDSIHLDLMDDPRNQRITYRLGGDDRVALLSGANSGGKTTLLEHLAQLCILARMGLPVPGDVTVPWLDEVHLVVPRRGLDAGAFETWLRGFLPLAEGDARRLVLADEVEAVTELEAATRILRYWIERLSRSDSLGVVVTHLAPQILATSTAQVRVDGIEATGLDAAHELIVDRCPRMDHLARSTPELILQRLVHTSKDTETRTMYQDLLDRFDGAPASTPRATPTR